MKPIYTQLNEKTDLEQFYGEAQNLPPLLICNSSLNNRERPDPNLQISSTITNSLLSGETIDTCQLNRNQNTAIYERNLPSAPLRVNVDMRPISSDKCSSPRFKNEVNDLEKYNQYEVSLKCSENKFMPGKGTISNYFNNIDVDSELKNINQIDTRCSERLFKIDPRDSQTKLSCYSTTLVQPNPQNELDAGYKWSDYQKCGTLEKFEKCASQKYSCPTPPVSNSILAQQEELRKLAIKRDLERITVQEDLALLDAKQNQTVLNKLDRNKVKYAEVPQSESIIQYKPTGVTNVYAPIVRQQKVDTERAENLGRQGAMDVQLDLKIKKRIAEYEKQLGLQCQGYNPNPENPSKLLPVQETQVYPFQCREQTRNLYKFNKLVEDSPDCLFCEQLFNNQTKRKHISVGRVPSGILNQ